MSFTRISVESIYIHNCTFALDVLYLVLYYTTLLILPYVSYTSYIQVLLAFDTERNLLELQYVFKELDTAILTYIPSPHTRIPHTTTTSSDLLRPNPNTYKRKCQNYDPTRENDQDQKLPINTTDDNNNNDNNNGNNMQYKPSPLESSYGDILKQLVFEGNATCNNMYHSMIYHKVSLYICLHVYYIVYVCVHE